MTRPRVAVLLAALGPAERIVRAIEAIAAQTEPAVIGVVAVPAGDAPLLELARRICADHADRRWQLLAAPGATRDSLWEHARQAVPAAVYLPIDTDRIPRAEAVARLLAGESATEDLLLAPARAPELAVLVAAAPGTAATHLQLALALERAGQQAEAQLAREDARELEW